MAQSERPEIKFTLDLPKTSQEQFIQHHFVTLMERGATEIEGQLIANMDDLRLCLRQALFHEQPLRRE